MNPNLPVGGSSFESMAMAGIPDSTGLSIFSLDYRATHFSDHFRGSTSISPQRTEALDVQLFSLSFTHYLSSALQAGLTVPIGDIRVVSLGGVAERVSGFGDIKLSLGYDLRSLWGKSARTPSVNVQGGILLPTGESRTADDTGGAPPNRVAIGNGAFGVAFDVGVSQSISDSWQARAFFGLRAPLHSNENDLLFGNNLSAGVGVAARVIPKVFLSWDLSYQRLEQSQQENGAEGQRAERIDLLNSGGTWLYTQAQLNYAPNKSYVLGINGQVPFYNKVEGEQIVQSWSLGLSVAHIFGHKEHKHDDHSGHDGHDDHEQVEENNHENHGKIKEKEETPEPDLDSVSTHGETHDKDVTTKQMAPNSEMQGDIAVLAAGGESFALEDAHIPGKWVIIDYWADWCAPCEGLTAYLKNQVVQHPELALRTVEVPSFGTPVAKEHLAKASGLPVVWILRPDGSVYQQFESADIVVVENALKNIVGSEEQMSDDQLKVSQDPISPL